MGPTLRWLQEFVEGLTFVGRQAVFSFRDNWGIAILSVVLAASLWVYVTDQDSETKTAVVPGGVLVEPVNVPPGQAVLSMSRESVVVRARAPEDVFDGLTAEDFRATVDLSAVTGQEATVDVTVVSTTPNVTVVDASPAQVTVRLEAVTSRRVPVRTKLLGPPPLGFEAQEIGLEPDEAIVSGPERLVDQVEAVEADLNLTGQRTNFEQQLLLQARDAQGRTIEGVDVEPEAVLVAVEIRQLEFSAIYAVRPQISGNPAPGFNVTAVEVDPVFVTISGSAEALQSLDPAQGVLTGAVSVEGATGDVVRAVALQLPQGVESDSAQVTVRVTVAAAQGSFTYSVAPEPVNVPSGLQASIAQQTVQVVLVGNINDLTGISASDIVVTVDLSGLSAGQHSVAVQVQAPAGTTVSSVQPVQVDVTLDTS